MTDNQAKHTIPTMMSFDGKAKYRLFQLFKLVGILLFVWIIGRIDRTLLLSHLRGINIPSLIGVTLLIGVLYVVKTARWHALVHSAGLKPSFYESWKIYNIGIFLAILTPAKIGEMGRAAYLKNAGMHGGTALTLVLIDRIMDMIVIAAIAVAGVGVLFGEIWFAGCLIAGCTICILAYVLWKKTVKFRQTWLLFTSKLTEPDMAATLLGWTLLGWTVYFVWAVLLARIIGIDVPTITLVAGFTITGIVSLLPVAPSGLGTRDAVLLAILAPYGVASEQAVALAFLMFATIIVSSVIGMGYWVRGLRVPQTSNL